MNLFAAEESQYEVYSMFTDGGSRGNPGPSASGVVLYNASGEQVLIAGEHLGQQTNNYAEYKALILGLEKAKERNVQRLICHLDSDLIVQQMNGNYKVKHPNIKPLYIKARGIVAYFTTCEFVHVYRKDNKKADAIVNHILDGNSVC